MKKIKMKKQIIDKNLKRLKINMFTVDAMDAQLKEVELLNKLILEVNCHYNNNTILESYHNNYLIITLDTVPSGSLSNNHIYACNDKHYILNKLTLEHPSAKPAPIMNIREVTKFINTRILYNAQELYKPKVFIKD